MRLRPVVSMTAVLGFLLAGFDVGRTASAIGSDRPIPKNVTTVGTMRVEAYGAGSPALVFIPGLECGAWVWDSAVRTYEKTHAVYVVTLPGFDGLPAAPGPALDGADASLLELLTKRGIDRPVLVGHSLGGFLALRFGVEHSNLVRGIVAVDGTPVLPPLSQSTPEQRAAAGDRISGRLAGLSASDFAAGQLAVIATMVTDPSAASQVAALTGKSDPVATGAYARELYSADLRPQLKSLTAPTLEIAPVPTKPAPFEGPEAATEPKSQRSAAYQSFYQTLFDGAPNVKVVPVDDSLHFVMIDQPQALYDAMSRFIASLPG